MHDLQHFVVTGNKDSTKNNFTHTMRVGVVATDIDSAITLVRKKHPNCKIFSVVHQGQIDILETQC